MRSIRLSEALASFALVLVCTTGAAAQDARATNVVNEELQLAVNEQKVIDSDGVRSFSEGVKGVVDIRLTKDNDKFVVVGLKAGKTTLLFIMLDGSEVHYDVTVTDPNAVAKPLPGAVEKRDNIRLDFYFVQLSETYGHNIGVAWPSSIGTNATMAVQVDLAAGQLSSATAVVSDQVLPRLDLAQSDGWAKIMRKAAVITANHTQASFSGGGEINIPVSGGFGGTIKQVSFGSTIGVVPHYDRNSGRIELQITADVSDLTPDGGTGVPGRTVSTLQTVVNLELGQSLVLAGLTSANEMRGQTGLPGLSQIPILGLLFGTQNASATETENVVFIVPTVIDTVGMQQRSLIDEALAAYESFDGDLDETPALMPERRR